MKPLSEIAIEKIPDAFDPDEILPARASHLVNLERRGKRHPLIALDTEIAQVYSGDDLSGELEATVASGVLRQGRTINNNYYTTSNDSRRLNKQIIECRQMLDAINGNKAWRNHPVVKSYSNHAEWLDLYMMSLDAYMYGRDDYSYVLSLMADKIRPEFHTPEYFDQMKRRLYTKDNKHYDQWASLGTSDVNWYFVDGEWVYYKNGKRILL